jgi:hypothetical protein
MLLYQYKYVMAIEEDHQNEIGCTQCLITSQLNIAMDHTVSANLVIVTVNTSGRLVISINA